MDRIALTKWSFSDPMFAPPYIPGFGALAFAIYYGLLAMSPGPNLLVVTAAGFGHSRREAMSAALGIALGAALLAGCINVLTLIIAKYGIAEATATLAFSAVLMTVGARQLVCAARTAEGMPERRCSPAGSYFLLALLTALTNPVSAGFFLVNAAPAVNVAPMPAGLMAGIVFAVAMTWFSLIAVLTAMPRARLFHARWRRPMTALSGVILIFVAVAAVSRLSGF